MLTLELQAAWLKQDAVILPKINSSNLASWSFSLFSFEFYMSPDVKTNSQAYFPNVSLLALL